MKIGFEKHCAMVDNHISLTTALFAAANGLADEELLARFKDEDESFPRIPGMPAEVASCGTAFVKRNTRKQVGVATLSKEIAENVAKLRKNKWKCPLDPIVIEVLRKEKLDSIFNEPPPYTSDDEGEKGKEESKGENDGDDSDDSDDSDDGDGDVLPA